MDQLLDTIKTIITKLEVKQPRYAPIYYILTSSLLFSINSMLSKFISNVPSSQIVYFRAIIMCLMNTIVTYNQKIPLYGFTSDIYKKLFMRSIFGCLGMICFYSGIKQVSVSEGQVLFRTSPLWTSLMAIYYLRTEKLQKSLFINLFLCFFGIFLISQPPILLNMFGYEKIGNQVDTQFMGIVLIISASVFSSIIQVLINSLAKSVNQLVILQYFSLISVGVTCMALFIIPGQQWLVPNLYEIFMLIMIGETSYFSQLLMNRAYIKGNLTEISMLGQSQVIYGYIFDIIMGTNLTLFSVLGIDFYFFNKQGFSKLNINIGIPGIYLFQRKQIIFLFQKCLIKLFEKHFSKYTIQAQLQLLQLKWFQTNQKHNNKKDLERM